MPRPSVLTGCSDTAPSTQADLKDKYNCDVYEEAFCSRLPDEKLWYNEASLEMPGGDAAQDGAYEYPAAQEIF